MKSKMRVIILVLLVAISVIAILSCTPGGTPTPIPDPKPPTDTGTGGGDPREPQYYGVGQLLPETLEYGDLVDVAVNEDFIYILDEEVVYAFTKSGVLVNTAAIPVTPAKGLTVIPDNPRPPDPSKTPYLFAKHVAVSHTPGPGFLGGCAVAIFGPNLDWLMNVQDDIELNILKRFDLPRYFFLADLGQPAELTIPNVTQGEDAIFQIYYTGDIVAARDGSLLQKATIDFVGVDPPPNSNQIIIYHPEVGPAGYHMYFPPAHDVPAPADIGDIIAEGDPVAVPWFEPMLGDQTGQTTNLALSSLYPSTREDTMNYYSGDATLTRDFVGVGQFLYDTTFIPTVYAFTAVAGNSFGWNRIIGEGYGSAPGSFAINPAINPVTGELEDPDDDNGGPAGIGIDPRTDDVFICDPGNRRVQIFNKTGVFLRQIGDGNRGTSGNSLIAPSSVTVDLDGTVYICDTNILRVFREADQRLEFGNLTGTVRNTKVPNPIPVVDATITVSNLSGGVVTTTLTDVNGQYRINNMLVGDYFVVANKFQYESDSTKVTMLADETVVANFNLFPVIGTAPGHITGVVLDGVTNLSIHGATVSVVGTSLTTMTDPNGFFTINDIEAGDWQVRFDMDLYNTAVRDVHIVESMTTTMGVIRMQPLLEGS